MKKNLLPIYVICATSFISCNNNAINNTRDIYVSSIAIKKEKCAVCKPPSRASIMDPVASVVSVVDNTSNADMVFIKGGSFTMGSNDFPDAKPLHKITVTNFWMDVH